MIRPCATAMGNYPDTRHPHKRLEIGRIETAGKDGKMQASELTDRGIWWQVAGFTLVGCISLAILELFAGSDAVAYQWFETAVTRL